MASADREGATGLGDLPEACISAILSCMQSAQDVLRASSVNSTFAAAAASNAVWQALLPAGSEEAIERALWDRLSPYDTNVAHASSQPLQQPAVHQIMGHLIAGVQPGGVPGGRGRFRGRPLLLVPNPLSAAGRRDADASIAPNSRLANETVSAGQHDVVGPGTIAGSASQGEEWQEATADLGPPETPKKMFQRLARGLLVGEGGLESFRADVGSGGVERMFSVLGAHITWGSDTRYWQRAPEHGSLFGASMFLKSVCWLEVRLQRRLTLPPGDYTVLWRLAIRQPGPWVHPVQFSVTTGDGVILTKPQSFAYGDYPVRPADTHQWTELEVGVISVRQEGELADEDPRGGSGRSQSRGVEVELDCIIREIEGGHWKSGLDLDCLIIRPRRTQQSVRSSEAGGLRSFTANAPDPLAELAETAANMGARLMRWIRRQ
ncbi:F-box domain containing protein [Klebsormidium nitens]|uniref:F-box domain containing protein n=1 Tax=Klebsormidium nitens TaxID=105231 RepID=A0A0U9HHR6_KLENI|nr:F-box domain containing protein [Klebsormidium nitens]|eukprot:GAQ77570.1 F-box domain containing protein [Klebsormidium nitens]